MRLEIGKRTLDRKLGGHALGSIGIVWLLVLGFSSAVAEDEPVLSRVTEDIRILSSDEMEGRGPGTRGLEKAGDYIRDEFRQLGLKSGASDDSYRQPFQVSLDFKPVPGKTSLTLRGPEGQAWQLEAGRDFQALAAGGSGKAQAPLVFAGYGISAPSLGYDDFEGLDVEGKVLLVLRQEPQQGDPNSKFDGKNITKHSYINTKLQQAKEHKAAAVLLVNAPFSTSAEGGDQLSAPNAFGSKAEGVPFAQVSQAVVDKLLAAAPLQAPSDAKLTNVVEAEKQIDSQLRPVSQPLGRLVGGLGDDLRAVDGGDGEHRRGAGGRGAAGARDDRARRALRPHRPRRVRLAQAQHPRSPQRGGRQRHRHGGHFGVGAAADGTRPEAGSAAGLHRFQRRGERAGGQQVLCRTPAVPRGGYGRHAEL